MTAKEYLQLYKQVDRRVEAKVDQLNRLHARVTLTAVAYSDMPKGGNTTDWTDIVDRYMEIEEELKTELDELRNTRIAVRDAIRSVPNELERAVLEMRYINGWSWPKITSAIHYQESQVYALHRRGLRAIQVPEI